MYFGGGMCAEEETGRAVSVLLLYLKVQGRRYGECTQLHSPLIHTPTHTPYIVECALCTLHTAHGIAKPLLAYYYCLLAQ